tara:strand:- start:1617 stop:2045 length:429 start_codon:yes stop_codon:yes gene_type:complete
MKIIIRTHGSELVTVPPFVLINMDTTMAIIICQAMAEVERLRPGFPECSLSFHDTSCTWLTALEDDLIEELDKTGYLLIEDYDASANEEPDVRFDEVCVSKDNVSWNALCKFGVYQVTSRTIDKAVITRIRDEETEEEPCSS